MSRTGRFVALRRPGGLDVVDALGTQPRRAIDGAADDFACVGQMLWVLAGGRIERHHLDTAHRLEPDVELGAGAREIRTSAGAEASTALVTGDRLWWVQAAHDSVRVEQVAAMPQACWPLAGRRALVETAGEIKLVEVGRGDIARWPRRLPGAIRDAASLFGGRAIALLLGGAPERLVVVRPSGELIHQIAIPDTRCWAFAEQRGVALLATGERALCAIDLRYGRIQAEGEPPSEVAALAIDDDAQYVAIAGPPSGTAQVAPVVHLPLTEVLAPARPVAVQPAVEPTPVNGRVLEARAPGVADVAVADDAPAELATDPAPVRAIPDLLPRALGEPLARLAVTAESSAAPYASAREHLDDLLDVVAAQAACAIASAWNSGQLSVPAEDRRPFEREVLAILGQGGDLAPDIIDEATRRLAERHRKVVACETATLAAGIALPFVDLSRQFGLSAIAAQALLVVLAPQVRGEIARLYGVLANDDHRPLVDGHLIEQIVAGKDRELRAEVAAALAADTPLIQHGLIRQGAGFALFAALSVEPVLIDRLRDQTAASSDDITTLRGATRPLDELRLPRSLVRELVIALAEPPAKGPLRLVLRGRRGAGRHTVVAALAARVGRRVAAIDASRLPRDGEHLAGALGRELVRAVLRDAVPIVSGLDLDPGDAAGHAVLRQVLRAHPGPIVIRTSPEARPPLDPGYLSFTLPPLSEQERLDAWRDALDRARLPCGDIDALAQRFRIGPGVIEQVVGEAAGRRAELEPDADAGALVIEVARQHIATRLDHVAQRVTRLAAWEQVALPEDLLDSLRELVGRVRHRRTVYERWGFDAKLTTARGLSALFYGPPGTGKSMIAGLIARELGLDLYKVDLARVVSKWIGETEKHLAEIFDAAEDGQVVILFDEADSLFAKRTEVKGSVDRYANLEVNYLLQRLDTFEGICILTTNLEGSIDPAFKRRMSFRLPFPFPDQDMRVRLWASHIPPETPVAGDFDFVDLARRFPLSGGYIRNSALRAAFLAAQEQQPLGQDHLTRAIHLEYRELGKLSASGRME